MPLPLHFPTFTALAQALEHDPNILQSHTAVVIGGVSYSIHTLAAHTEFQLAIRVLTNVQSAEQQDQASGHPTVTDLLAQWLQQPLDQSQAATSATQQPPSLPILPDFLPHLDDIDEWLQEQDFLTPAEAVPPQQPTPPTFPPSWVSIEDWLQQQPSPQSLSPQPPSPPAAQPLAPLPPHEGHMRPFSSLSHKEKVERCQEATKRLLQGESTDTIARDLNIPRKKVLGWRQQVLAARTPPPSPLSTEQLQTINSILTSSQPKDHGFKVSQWCPSTLQAMIQRQFQTLVSLVAIKQLFEDHFTPPAQPIRPTRTRHSSRPHPRTNRVAIEIPLPTRAGSMTISWSRSRVDDPLLRERVKHALRQGVQAYKAASLYGANTRTTQGWAKAMKEANQILASDPRSLREEQAAIIVNIIREKTPEFFNFEEDLWTCLAVQQLALYLFGTSITEDIATNILQSMATDTTTSSSAVFSAPPFDDTQHR